MFKIFNFGDTWIGRCKKLKGSSRAALKDIESFSEANWSIFSLQIFAKIPRKRLRHKGQKRMCEQI